MKFGVNIIEKNQMMSTITELTDFFRIIIFKEAHILNKQKVQNFRVTYNPHPFWGYRYLADCNTFNFNQNGCFTITMMSLMSVLSVWLSRLSRLRRLRRLCGLSRLCGLTGLWRAIHGLNCSGFHTTSSSEQ